MKNQTVFFQSIQNNSIVGLQSNLYYNYTTLSTTGNSHNFIDLMESGHVTSSL
jgi:hypothetical protein